MYVLMKANLASPDSKKLQSVCGSDCSRMQVGLQSDAVRTPVGCGLDCSRMRVGLQSDAVRTPVGCGLDSSRMRSGLYRTGRIPPTKTKEYCAFTMNVNAPALRNSWENENTRCVYLKKTALFLYNRVMVWNK